MLYQLEEIIAGHIKVLGGPHVARGPDVAKACPSVLLKKSVAKLLICKMVNNYLSPN